MQIVFPFSGGGTSAEQVKASGGCHRFLRETFRGELRKNLGANTRGEFDFYRGLSAFVSIAHYRIHFVPYPIIFPRCD